MTWQVILIILSSIASLLTSLVSGLLLYNLKEFLARMTNAEREIKDLRERQSSCKIDCTREFVTAEAYVRSSAYDRQKIDQISDTLNRMAGNMAVIEKLPQISGEIAANITRQILQSQRSNPNG